MPGGEEAGEVGMYECHRGGEGGVIIDDEGQVGHGFVAFVHGRGKCGVGKRGGGWVDDVDCTLPAR